MVSRASAIDVVALLHRAQIEAAHDAGQDADFREGLEVLVQSINADSGLAEADRAWVEDRLLRLVANRLRIERDIAAHPEILDIELLAPVVITHLPRTGSTKLHRMLAATGKFHTLTTWQGMYPAPWSTGGDDTARRIAATDEHLAWMDQRSPAARIGHPMATHEVEEETLLLEHGFRSPFLHMAYYDVPGFAAWLQTQDPVAAYADLARMLRYMQWRYHPEGGKPWVLKTPAHLGNEGAIEQVFPEARFVVTHRDPVALMASASAALCSQRMIYAQHDISAVAGQWCLGAFSELMRRHMLWRSTTSSAVYDLAFVQIAQHEMTVVDEVLRFAGLLFDGPGSVSLRKWLAEETARRRPEHRYSLDDYGLGVAAINSAFGDYRTHYAEYLGTAKSAC